MKKLFNILRKQKTAALAAVFVSVWLVQCSPDDKQDQPAPSTPTADPKLRFVADWTCVETINSQPPAQPFHVHCTNSTADTVLLENFYALGFQHKPKAVIYGDSIRIAPNNQVFSGITVIDGKGKLVNSSKMIMIYHVNNTSTIDTVSAVFTK
jgi:hypothetical protein